MRGRRWDEEYGEEEEVWAKIKEKR